MSLLNNSNAIPTTGGDYNLENSLRFRSSASAYLSRTPTTAGNRKTWTFSCWTKRGLLTGSQVIFSAANSGNTQFVDVTINGNNVFELDILDSNSTRTIRTSTAVLRDPSAWYHVVLVIDTTQATATDRIKLYVNNELLTTSAGTGTFPNQNADTQVNATTGIHAIARRQGSADRYYDAYLTEINHIDGTALTPSDFGDYNSTTGVWQPKEYTGTYGTNGFYLPMNQTANEYSIEYLLVAGGGGGGILRGGGGGAGGYRSLSATVAEGESYTITIGAGGAGDTTGSAGVTGEKGNNTSAFSTSATGGGGGAGNHPSNDNADGQDGGSGGGGNGSSSPRPAGSGNEGSYSPVEGYDGGASISGGAYSGAGGGASEAGGTDGLGHGGDGLTWYDGVARGGGGSGGGISGSSALAGGSGGGGSGGTANYSTNLTPTSGTANTGGGGGGAGDDNTTAGSGGSGIVVIRYTGSQRGSGGTVTSSGGYTYHTFNSLGSYTA
jgi:hypothetical protein